MVQLIQINSAINLVQSVQWTLAPILPLVMIPNNTMIKISFSNSQFGRIGRRSAGYTQIYVDFPARSQEICVDLRASGKSAFHLASN